MWTWIDSESTVASNIIYNVPGPRLAARGGQTDSSSAVSFSRSSITFAKHLNMLHCDFKLHKTLNLHAKSITSLALTDCAKWVASGGTQQRLQPVQLGDVMTLTRSRGWVCGCMEGCGWFARTKIGPAHRRCSFAFVLVVDAHSRETMPDRGDCGRQSQAVDVR